MLPGYETLVDGLEWKNEMIVLEANDEATRNCAVDYLSNFADSIHTSHKDNRVYLWYLPGSKVAKAKRDIEQTMQTMGLKICPPQVFAHDQQGLVKLRVYVPSTSHEIQPVAGAVVQKRVDEVCSTLRRKLSTTKIVETTELLRTRALSDNKLDETMSVLTVETSAEQLKAALPAIVAKSRQWCRKWKQSNVGIVVDSQVFLVTESPGRVLREEMWALCEKVVHTAQNLFSCKCIPLCQD